MSAERRGAAAAGRRTLRRIHRRLGLHPVFLPLVLRLTPLGSQRTITTDTDLVVEGFPRSGNTYTAFALRHANPMLTISSHAHVPAQVTRAVRLGTPTLIVVREPWDAVASLLVAAPHVTERQALQDYIRHHEALLNHRSSVVIADFAEVTTDLGSVVDRLRRRFDLTLAAPRAEDQPAVLLEIEAHHAALHGGSTRLDPRPIEARANETAAAKVRLEHPRQAPLLNQARAVHEALIRAPNAGCEGP